MARRMVGLLESCGEHRDEGVSISFPITRQEIAEMTGTTLHTVSRLLSAWKDRGLVITGRKRITVCRPDDLIRLAEGSAPAPSGAGNTSLAAR